MKPPKEPKTFNYPRMYYQEAYGDLDVRNGDRIRIVYPSGEISWATLCPFTINDGYVFYEPPCFLDPHNLPTTGQEALRLMRIYDASRNYPKAEFIGEIK